MTVWDYLDYRDYLRAFYARRKTERAGFSYRVFSERTGIKSPNYMKLIIDGERHVTSAHARRIARFCGLDGEGTAYFMALVRWNGCREQAERESLWNEVLRARRSAPHGKFPHAHLNILTRWKTIAILEMMRLKDFEPTPEWIRARFRGGISDEEITDAIRSLESAGLVENYRLTHRHLRTEDDIPSPCIRGYHRAVMEDGIRALEETPVEAREFISNTLAIRRADLPRLKEEMRRFRDFVLELTSQGTEPEEVYQLCFQLFPISK